MQSMIVPQGKMINDATLSAEVTDCCSKLKLSGTVETTAVSPRIPLLGFVGLCEAAA